MLSFLHWLCTQVVEHCHPHQSGHLLLFLARRYLLSPFAALARQANAAACARVESVFRSAGTVQGRTEASPSSPSPRDMITENELAELMDLLRSGRVSRRYGRLVSLLNR